MANEFEVLTTKMDAGFEKVMAKFEDFTKQFYEHQIPCVKEFASLNERLAIKNAVNCAENKQTEKERDWGKWMIRLFLALLAAGYIGLWFK